jgi:hypothetical protein
MPECFPKAQGRFLSSSAAEWFALLFYDDSIEVRHAVRVI